MNDSIKALPVRLVNGRCEQCDPEDATHVQLNMPGPSGRLTLPVILRGPRAGTPCWTWNGSVTSPTLRPSVRTRGHDYTCHSWINDGAVQFLSDSTHDLAGQTVSLLPVEETNP